LFLFGGRPLFARGCGGRGAAGGPFAGARRFGTGLALALGGRSFFPSHPFLGPGFLQLPVAFALPLVFRTAAALRPAVVLAGERGLAERAEAPARIDRFAAGRARVLQAALAVRAAEVVFLHRVLAVRAGLLAQLAHPQLRGFDLQFALVGVLEELGRADDRVDGRADEGEERGDRRAADQERVGDPAARVEEGVDDQRQPEDDQQEQNEGRGQVQTGVGDAEDCECHG
jgi:hypothetical protein